LANVLDDLAPADRTKTISDRKENMRRATKTIATWFGMIAGIAGLEHGYFELQGIQVCGLMFFRWTAGGGGGLECL
jgi:hypothetical protein